MFSNFCIIYSGNNSGRQSREIVKKAIRDPCFGENGSPMFSVDEEGRAICLFGLKNSLDYQCDIGLMEASYGEFDYYGGDIFALRVTFVDDWMRDYIKLRSDEV